MTAIARHIAESRSTLPMWHLCADKTCLGFASTENSLCHVCLMDEAAANYVEQVREWERERLAGINARP